MRVRRLIFGLLLPSVLVVATVAVALRRGALPANRAAGDYFRVAVGPDYNEARGGLFTACR